MDDPTVNLLEDVPPAYQAQTFWVPDLIALKRALLSLTQGEQVLCYLDSNQYRQTLPQRYECLVATGAESVLSCSASTGAFQRWQEFSDQGSDWQFGFLTYDLKNDVEDLQSENTDELDFPSLYFFRPLHVFELLIDGTLRISSKTIPPTAIFQKLLELMETPPTASQASNPGLTLTPRVSRDDYLNIVQKIRDHILAGDVYEMNYCQEFFAREARINPWQLFQQLNDQTRAPFAAFLRTNEHYLLSASPERFLFKEGDHLISQPIKGTIRRSANPIEDTQLERDLYHSEKDRAENVMIVDLVRNDLARSCQAGTVRVEELFGIYPFAQVFQMISTVSGKLAPEVTGLEALRRAFPMGSMTGAPKVMTMKLIEQYEASRRGLYSGAVGYVTPQGNFDFNVVIRSLLYNAASRHLSLQVGGAIVYDSDPREEYEECLLKAQAAFELLGHSPASSTEKPRTSISSQKVG